MKLSLLTLLFALAANVHAQTFQDATHLIRHLPNADRFVPGGAAVDVNGDGLVDVYHSGMLHIQNPDGTFSNRRPESGIVDHFGEVQGGIWADADNDGFLDVFLVNLTGRSLLYGNPIFGQFEGRSTGPILQSGATGAVWGDFDSDNLLDLVVTTVTGVNPLYIQGTGGAFSNLSSSGLRTARKTCGAAASDFDKDGRLDLYFASCDTSVSTRSADSIFKNAGNRAFRDLIAQQSLLGNFRYTRGAFWLDYDGDGDQDAFALNHIRDLPPHVENFANGLDQIYRNDGADMFALIGPPSGIAGGLDEQGYSAATADFNNDGRLDVLVLNWPATKFENSTADHLFVSDEQGSFNDVWPSAVAPELPSRLSEELAAVVADFNNDGWIDIFFLSRYGNRLLLNTPDENHWLKVSLRGTTTNRFGIGARIELFSGGGRQLREIHAGEGYASQHHNLTAHFGLGSETRADSLVVYWPSGTKDVIVEPPLDQWIAVAEGAGLDRAPSTPALTAPEHNEQLSFTLPHVEFTWLSSTDADGDPITYEVYVRGGDLDTVITASQASASLNTAILRQGERYTWTVIAKDRHNIRRASDVFVFSYAGSSVFPALKSLLPFPGVEMGGLDLGDYDGDGDLDLVVVGMGPAGPVGNVYEAVDTTIISGSSLYQFKTYRRVPTLLDPVEKGSVRWGDYDADGDLDILATGKRLIGTTYRITTTLYIRTPSGYRPADEVSLPGIVAGEAVFVDYDNDRDLDILITGAVSETLPLTPITGLYENVGGRYRKTDAQLEQVYHSSTEWGDYDGDGDLDLALMGDRGNGDLVTRIYRNDGAARFTPVADLMGLAYGSMSWGDFDADGDLDLLVGGSRFGPELLSGYVRIYRNDGGSFRELPPERDFAQLGAGGVAWTDYDGDGDLDIVIIGSKSLIQPAQLYAYRNEGGGRFAIEFATEGLLLSKLAVGDFNADGDVDVVALGSTKNGDPRLTIYLNQIIVDAVPQ